MRNNGEKEDSCTGLTNCIKLNAKAILPAFVPFLVAVNSWHGQTPPALHTTFGQLLEAFAQNLGMPISEWLSNPNVLQSLARPDQNKTGLDVIESSIGWDSRIQHRRWCLFLLRDRLLVTALRALLARRLWARRTTRLARRWRARIPRARGR